MKKKRKGNTYDDMLSAVRYELKLKYRKYTIVIVPSYILYV